MSGIDERRSPPVLHDGPAHSSPYPASRLAPGFGLVDLAREIEQADRAVAGRLGAQLEVIAEQVKSLQAQARRILEQARSDQRLHHARCAFRRIPGKTYHLYEHGDGSLTFSMLSPDDWGGRPPHTFVGSYRLESDLSWVAADAVDDSRSDSRALVSGLLAACSGSDQDDGARP
ncbi:MAG: DUF2452 domain-containing protein [Gammaproteobacteria bacterium]|nr:DUF2452 domain-containing protein [Gammaproteobacteria bacterium]